MLKKILIFLGIIISLIILGLVILVGSWYISQVSTNNKIKLCTETGYNIKNVEQNKKYSLKNDPNQDRLQIQIIKALPTKNATTMGGASVFGGPVFQGCWMQQDVKYNILFNNKIVGNTNFDKNGETTAYNFGDNLRFLKRGEVLDKSVEYNFEEKFLNSFKIQTKNGLDLYTKVKDDFWQTETQDDDEVFVVENNSLNLVDIPRSLFPSDSGYRKNYTDFRKNADKLEITFRLGDKMIQTLQDPKRGGFSKEEEYAKLWQGGFYTFCFEKIAGANKYTLCDSDKDKFKVILNS